VSAASIGFAMQNVALWTDYEGPDPEVITSPGANFNRTDFLTLPNPKRSVLRINLTF
jgi:hypothetical protein